MRVHVVEHAEHDQEQPPEDDRHPLADATAVGVERGVDRPSSDVLPAPGSFAGAGLCPHRVVTLRGDAAKVLALARLKIRLNTLDPCTRVAPHNPEDIAKSQANGHSTPPTRPVAGRVRALLDRPAPADDGPARPLARLLLRRGHPGRGTRGRPPWRLV